MNDDDRAAAKRQIEALVAAGEVAMLVMFLAPEQVMLLAEDWREEEQKTRDMLRLMEQTARRT